MVLRSLDANRPAVSNYRMKFSLAHQAGGHSSCVIRARPQRRIAMTAIRPFFTSLMYFPLGRYRFMQRAVLSSDEAIIEARLCYRLTDWKHAHHPSNPTLPGASNSPQVVSWLSSDSGLARV
ncbi:unnamed protein product [Fusarium graminearum]|uniref:Chromosome 1, complete genome n=2 Tax=Gibberella zeae TaxID=5518 RepID=I1S4K7_GIBZE|nr:hypothetical protein FGSG_11775 [Fusarium graminearum PH-1]CAF3551875.1 unnamed protein product [Fusarium graminearum]ESU05706.1 hypothetical protein FGSG_11775 [Fusarium graminearum PH-1]CAF3579365.1 unnamed protein product [Fusarium graminearum]CAG1964462.1 unnamed protein product [Fusarium graminearum]CAG1997771.1 unnamed protein product [Fusarium graminearum]|eukprot:XP_011316191.1 hypothetical protein FGSG_11775 [Fusarium graminearum PH-1]